MKSGFGLQQPHLVARAVHQQRIAKFQRQFAHIGAIRATVAPQSDDRQAKLLPKVDLLQRLTDDARARRDDHLGHADRHRREIILPIGLGLDHDAQRDQLLHAFTAPDDDQHIAHAQHFVGFGREDRLTAALDRQNAETQRLADAARRD